MFYNTFKNYFLHLIFVFIVFANSCNLIFSQQVWTNFVDSVSTLSSPRAIDLNSDGIKDIVVGAGTDSIFSNYGILAFDGSNGQQLWHLPTPDEIFTSAIFSVIINYSIILRFYYKKDLNLIIQISGLNRFYAIKSI